jgi:hypothetical protein
MVRVIRVEDVIGQGVFKTCVLIAITYGIYRKNASVGAG